MSLRRLAVIVLSAAGALLAAVVLYLAFGDLGRHKGRIETLATQLLGRPFAIDGVFELEVLPSISLVAERVRLGNAHWGSQPQMVEIGRVSAQVGLWSLVSGPVDVRSFELTDVAVLLETNAEGEGNWVFGEAGAPAEAREAGAGSATSVPAVILRAKLANVRTTYRARGKPDRVALIESLSIAPGADGLLAISGKGRLNELPAALSGEIGPMEALFAGRDIRMAIQAALGELQVDVKGGLGRLDPLDGADLGMKIAHPDIGSMLGEAPPAGRRGRPPDGRRPARPTPVISPGSTSPPGSATSRSRSGARCARSACRDRTCASKPRCRMSPAWRRRST